MHAHVPHDTPGVPRVVAAVRAVLTRGGFTRGGTEGVKHASSEHARHERAPRSGGTPAMQTRLGVGTEVAEDMYVHGASLKSFLKGFFGPKSFQISVKFQ